MKKKDDPDGSLVLRAQQGETEAFGQLYKEKYESIYSFVMVKCKNPHDAKEVVNETFLRAWKALPNFRMECTFWSWMCGIAKNVIYDRFKKRRPEIQHLGVEDNDMYYLFYNTPDHANHFLREEIVEAINLALRCDFSDKEIRIIRAKLEGTKYKELAEELDLSISVIRNLRKRSIVQLRDRLRRFGFDEG